MGIFDTANFAPHIAHLRAFRGNPELPVAIVMHPETMIGLDDNDRAYVQQLVDEYDLAVYVDEHMQPGNVSIEEDHGVPPDDEDDDWSADDDELLDDEGADDGNA